MAKVAIKSENITSFGGIYHVMDVFPNLTLKNSHVLGLLCLPISLGGGFCVHTSNIHAEIAPQITYEAKTTTFAQ